MQSIIVVFIVGTLVAYTLAVPFDVDHHLEERQRIRPEVDASEKQEYEATRYRKSAYAGPIASYASPAIPCAKNLVVSCQPSVAPVPCAPSYSAPLYQPGSYSASYSEPVPTYAVPQYYRDFYKHY